MVWPGLKTLSPQLRKSGLYGIARPRPQAKSGGATSRWELPRVRSAHSLQLGPKKNRGRTLHSTPPSSTLHETGTQSSVGPCCCQFPRSATYDLRLPWMPSACKPPKRRGTARCRSDFHGPWFQPRCWTNRIVRGGLRVAQKGILLRLLLVQKLVLALLSLQRKQTLG